MTTYGAALSAARNVLRNAGTAGAAGDARLLMMAAADLDMAALIGREGEELPAAAEAVFGSHLERRLAGEPVARILGEHEFWGLPFRITPATLDPRADTETLVEAVLGAIGPRREQALVVLDLGTGSGCILAALLSECPRASGIGVEADPAAAAVARDNLERLGLGERAEVRVGNWLAGLECRFDVIVSNPPYVRQADIEALPVEVREFDPHLALGGGADGLQAYRDILAGIGPVLAEGAVVAFEVGSGQAAAVAALSRQAGLSSTAIRCDLAGIERVVLAAAPA